MVVAEGEDGTHTVIANEVISSSNEKIPPYYVGTDISKQPWDHMLASVNPVASAVPNSQLAQPDNPEARVYGSMAEVWPYGLFHVGYMVKMVQVPCVYNSPPWVIRSLTINELDTLWYVPLLLQEKLE